MGDTWIERKMSEILNSVPGYHGYRDKESRRDADRIVRDRIVQVLTGKAERIERVATRLAEKRRIHEVGQVNDLASSVRHVADRINTASYGYGGVFGDRDVNAAVLDQLRLFDESLFAGVEEIEKVATSLESAMSSNEDLSAATLSGQESVQQLLSRVDLRKQVIETAQPATPVQMSGVLDVLQTPEEIARAKQPPAAYELHDRDALAVLGDNFVVDARIDFESAAGAYRLFRIDVAPDKWLLVPRKQGEPFAVLTMTREPYVAAPTLTIGDEGYVVEGTGHGTGDVVGAGGQSDRRPLTYTMLRGATSAAKRAVVLQWGSEQHVLAGNEVHPNDVEIYGKPS